MSDTVADRLFEMAEEVMGHQIGEGDDPEFVRLLKEAALALSVAHVHAKRRGEELMRCLVRDRVGVVGLLDLTRGGVERLKASGHTVTFAGEVL